MATQRQLIAFALLEAEGLTAEGAGAVTGNLSQEVGNNLPSEFRHSGLDHGSQALPQWRDSKGAPRLTRYMEYVRGLHPELIRPGMTTEEIDAAMWVWYGNMALQIEYLAIELREYFPALDAKLRHGGDINSLTEDFCWQFENPNRQAANLTNRQRQALYVFSAASHLSPRKESTQANIEAAKKTVAAQTSTTNARCGVMLGGLIAGLHWYGGMPGNMALVAGAVVALLVVYSLFAAQRAKFEAALASSLAGKISGVAPVPVPAEPAPMEPAAEKESGPEKIPSLRPSMPTAAPEWIYEETLGRWIYGEAPPPAPPTPPPPPSPLMTSDIGAIAAAVAKLLDEKLAVEFTGMKGNTR